MDEIKAAQLTVTRPDGTVVYQMVVRTDDRVLLGQLYVDNGQIWLRASSDPATGRGSIVQPIAAWVGDMSFSVKVEP